MTEQQNIELIYQICQDIYFALGKAFDAESDKKFSNKVVDIQLTSLATAIVSFISSINELAGAGDQRQKLLNSIIDGVERGFKDLESESKKDMQ